MNLTLKTLDTLSLIPVTLGSPSGETFKGFQTRAQMVSGDQEELLGRFIEAPEEAKLKYWYPEEEEQYVRYIAMIVFSWLLSIFNS